MGINGISLIDQRCANSNAIVITMDQRFVLGSLCIANLEGFEELDPSFHKLVEQLDVEHSIKKRKRIIEDYVNERNPLPRNATPTQCRNNDIMRRLTRNNIQQFMVEAFILYKLRERDEILTYENQYLKKQLDIALFMHKTVNDDYKVTVKNKIIHWKTKLLDLEEKISFFKTVDAMYEEEHKRDKDIFTLDFYHERTRPRTLYEYEQRLAYWVKRLCDLNAKYLRIIDMWDEEEEV